MEQGFYHKFGPAVQGFEKSKATLKIEKLKAGNANDWCITRMV